MKTRFNPFLIGLLALPLAVRAQSAPTNAPPLFTTNSQTVSMIYSNGTLVGSFSAPAPALNPALGGSTSTNFLVLAAKDLWNNIKLAYPFNTNGNASLTGFGGVNTASKKPVYGAALTIPTSPNTGIGVLVANKGGEWFEGGANFTFGQTNNWPVLGLVRSKFGEGVVYNLRTREPANYSFIGFDKQWTISSRWDLALGVLAANTSDEPGVDVLAEFKATYWWGKRRS